MSSTVQDAEKAAPIVINQSGNGLTKPVRRLRKIFAAAVKPPQMVPDESGNEDHQYFTVYVTDAGDEKRQLCTFEVWKKSQGYPTPSSKEPTTKGYKGKLDHRFLIGFPEPEGLESGAVEKIVTSIDLIKIQPTISLGVRMADLANQKMILAEIDPYSGEVEIKAYPQELPIRTLPGLILSMDACERLYPGQHLKGDFEIRSVNGNMIEILPPSALLT